MKLKVYGLASHWPGANNNNQVRLIVAAPTQKNAAKLLRVSLSYFRGHFAETHNDIEVGVALNQPGIVFWSKMNVHGAPYLVAPGQTANET